MRESGPTAVRIGRLRLRLPARGGEDGRRMATEISQRLAAGLPPSFDRRLEGSSLRLRLNGRESAGDTAAAVAGAITSRLDGSRDG